MKHVVKRRGHTESYDERKVYASIYAACISVDVPQVEAELVAAQLCKDLSAWLTDKTEITSADIFRAAWKHLDAYNSKAGYMYKHLKVVS